MTVNFKIFKIILLAQTINRSYPYIDRDIKWFIQTGIMLSYFTLVFCVVLYTFIHNLLNDDFSTACKDGHFVIMYLVVIFQNYILLYHRNQIKILIESMKKDYELSQLLSAEEQVIVESYAKQGVYVCKQWLLIPLMGSFSFHVQSVGQMVYYYYKNDFRKVPYYDLIYPSFIEDNKDNIFIFLFTYCFVSLYTLYGAIMYVAYVPLGPIMMLHASGQLEIVRGRIDHLFDEVSDMVIKAKLNGIVKQLQYIYSFVDIIQNVFEVAYELTLKATAILVPFALYEIIEAKHRGEFSLIYFLFVFGGILITSSPCYYSDVLMDKGEDVRLALYTCGWEVTHDRSTRSTLLILLVYALRPVAIRTIFRTVCLDALTDIFQESYAIFNLLNAVW